MEALSTLTFAGFAYLLWHGWGAAARHVGVSRLALLGLIFTPVVPWRGHTPR